MQQDVVLALLRGSTLFISYLSPSFSLLSAQGADDLIHLFSCGVGFRIILRIARRDT